MIIIDAKLDQITKIGRVGENETRVIRFNVKDILEEFPGATIYLLNKRVNDPSSYPVPNTEIDGDYLLWTVSSGDVAQVGIGNCELKAVKDNAILKDDIYVTKTETALDGSEEPPDPWQGWIDEVMDAVGDAQQAVVDAKAEADRAEQAASSITNAYLATTLIQGNEYQMYIERV